jgi:hypothetical protein
MQRTRQEIELSKKRINGLILFIDVLLIIYILLVLLYNVSPEFKEWITGLFS